VLGIIIPARDEPYLQQTIDDLLAKAAGDVRIVVILDGWWPVPIVNDHPRVTLIHRSSPMGMRNGINSGVTGANTSHILKIDAHCSISEGYDNALLKYDRPGVVQVPVRYRLDPDTWERKNKACEFQYIRQEDLKGRDWRDYASRVNGLDVCELMTMQGSCWFMSRQTWDSFGGLDDVNYGGMGREAQEVSLKAWLSGGKVLLNRTAWYGHWDKDRGLYGDTKDQKRKSMEFALDFWKNDRWEKAKRPLISLVEQFSPVPTWEEVNVVNRTDMVSPVTLGPMVEEVTVEASPPDAAVLLAERYGSRPEKMKGCGREGLYRLFSELGYKIGAEIGVYSGRNARNICKNMPGVKLYLVDPWDFEPKDYAVRVEERARARVEGFDTTVIKATSAEAARLIPDGSLDFVHLDADTTYDSEMQDIILWSRKVRKGGIVSGIGYVDLPHIRARQAVDDYIRAHKIPVLYLTDAGAPRGDKKRDKYPVWLFVKPADRWKTSKELLGSDDGPE
jgi:Methyltransferase domain/Glycosyl transferase family 2